MGWSAFRGLVSCLLLVLLPGSLFAADSNAAMVYTNGAAWINGTHIPRSSSAIFAGDLLQTRSDSVANINQAGSSIEILSDSLVKFEGSSVRIEHGAVTVSTGKKVGTTAGDVKVVPASNAWTQFNVRDVDGTVHIVASKGDLEITDGNGTTTLAQGQETTRDENSGNDQNDKNKKKKKQQSGAPVAATGGILSSPYAIAGGAAVIGGVTTWVLLQNDNPASPAKP
jgi:hypothetical protein